MRIQRAGGACGSAANHAQFKLLACDVFQFFYSAFHERP
jgi:hypothetical protein